MNKFKPYCGLLIAIIIFVSPWSNTYAAEKYQKAGVIYSVGYDEFTIRTEKFRFAPGAVIQSNDPRRSKFSDFKRGDFVIFEGILLNGVKYVNLIQYQELKPN